MKLRTFLYESDYRPIHKGTYNHEMVTVYCGLNAYSDNVEDISQLFTMVKEKYPAIPPRDMHVVFIPSSRSNNYANRIMVHIDRPLDEVKENLHKYILM